MPSRLADRLHALGLTLPPPARPSSEHYVAAVRSGALLFISGQLCKWGDEVRHPGRLGDTLTLEQGQAAAELAALNLLRHIMDATGDDLDRVARIVKLTVFVAATPGFAGHSQVGNGASALLARVFGEAGRHARTSVGVASLPHGAAVEIEAVVELHDPPAIPA